MIGDTFNNERVRNQARSQGGGGRKKNAKKKRGRGRICNARIGLKKKSTVMHYKTIKFNIKTPLNTHNFHFCGVLRAKSLILRLCAPSAPIFFCHFSNFAPSIRKMDRRHCPPPWGFHESAPLKENPGYALVRNWSMPLLPCDNTVENITSQSINM